METWFWILGWCLSILTMIGNGFVIFVIWRKRSLRTKTNAFIVSLAVADFCVGMNAFPPLFFWKIASDNNFQGVSLKVLAFINELFLYASAVNLCSLVLDRYMAIVKPLQYLTFMKRRRVIQVISFSWTISVSFTVFVRTLRYSFKTQLFYNIVGWSYVLFELSLCAIVIFCFTSMLVIVCKHDRSARTLSKQLRFNHRVFFKTQDKSALKMMTVVVCLFLVCYGLFLYCSFVYMFYYLAACIIGYHYRMLISILNSAVNPLAYAVFKRDIKKEFKRMIYSSILKRTVSKVESHELS